MGKQLTLLGADVEEVLTIKDTMEAITGSMDYLIPKVDVILITGGLGPTKDDITKHALCTYFDSSLEINTDILKHIEAFFAKRNREMLEVNVQQAALPVACTVLPNKLGTAAGMWFEKDNTTTLLSQIKQ